MAVTIRPNFPPGLAQPALRALAAAGYVRLDDLVQVRESDLRRLHGLGPKGVETLRVALRAQRKSFLPEQA